MVPFPATRKDTIAEMYSIWRAMSEDGTPRFEDFNPLSLPDHLNNCWIVKVEQEPQRFRFCFFGRGLFSLVGRDRTHELLPATNDAEKPLETQLMFEQICKSGRPSWRKGATELKTFDTQNIDIEMIALPLFSDNKSEVTHILGFSLYFKANGEPLEA